MDNITNDLLELGHNRKLYNLINAIPYVKSEMIKLSENVRMTEEYYIHGTIMARILSDMHLQVSDEELDMLLTSALCHSICEVYPDYDINNGMKSAGIEDKIIEFVLLMVEADKSDSDVNVFDDRLLFIIKLVERVNLIEHLCDMSAEEAKAFIHETKRSLLPMCIDGKEKYPEFSIQISILLEKMRTLIQVMDILFSRYDTEQEELYTEILSYKDENFRIRKAFARFT